jgi:hypothetical protein
MTNTILLETLAEDELQLGTKASSDLVPVLKYFAEKELPVLKGQGTHILVNQLSTAIISTLRLTWKDAEFSGGIKKIISYTIKLLREWYERESKDPKTIQEQVLKTIDALDLHVIYMYYLDCSAINSTRSLDL